ncbi:MAG TPA: hypothetical protein VGI16_09950 [Candidatus Acidoferrum sp.]|jgi:hypothetical protein
MRLRKLLSKSLFGKAALVVAALVGGLFFAGTASAHPREWRDYRAPVVRVEGGYFRGPIVRERIYAPAPVYRFDNCWRDRYGRLHRY